MGLSLAETYEVVEKPDWRIETLSDCDWALARIADMEAERAENEELAAREIARVKARLEKLNGTVDRGLAFFRSHVEAFANTHRELLLKGGKKKSRPLMNGTVGWRKAGGGLKLYDREKLLEWARQHPGCVRTSEDIYLGAVKEHCVRTGEIPPGMDLDPERENFFIKTDRTQNQEE